MVLVLIIGNTTFVILSYWIQISLPHVVHSKLYVSFSMFSVFNKIKIDTSNIKS